MKHLKENQIDDELQSVKEFVQVDRYILIS